MPVDHRSMTGTTASGLLPEIRSVRALLAPNCQKMQAEVSQADGIFNVDGVKL